MVYLLTSIRFIQLSIETYGLLALVQALLGHEWWVRLLLIALLISGIAGIYRYYIFRLKSRQSYENTLSFKIQELERQRFAQELHDGIGANLSLLKMYLTSIGDAKVPQEELRTRSLLVLHTTLDEVHSLIHNLHPRSLTTLGLPASIKAMVDAINQSQKLKVYIELETLPQLSPTVEINLFRIVQELLQNTIKHAQATKINLSLRIEGQLLCLHYQDDGKGIAQVPLHQGNGLLNIQQRVALLKGHYLPKATSTQGFQLEITAPLCGK